MKKIPRITAAVLVLTLLLSLAGCGASDGKTRLKFQIWDTAQQAGMQAMCEAYTAQHPDVVIDVQIVSWNEYWTKLEAAAESNTLPDIFWMHTNQLLYYADFGMLADVTDLYDDVESGYYQNHFSEISLGNISGSNGRYYGVPKDKDNGVLVYNKEMFDQAGVAYPNDDWTWDDLVDASQKIYDATGNYGYLAYLDDQLGYWSYVYQNGGYILSADKTTSGFNQPGGKEAISCARDRKRPARACWCAGRPPTRRPSYRGRTRSAQRRWPACRAAWRRPRPWARRGHAAPARRRAPRAVPPLHGRRRRACARR